MKLLNKTMLSEIKTYAKSHTVKETAEHFSVNYNSMQVFLARYKIKHLPRKCLGVNNSNYKVGFSMNKKLYWVYHAMLQRCYNSKCKAFLHYGSREIKVCKEWLTDKTSFYKWSLEHGYRDGLTLDRINNDGNYEPSNCIWVTNKENCNHTRRTHFLTYQGKTQSLRKWSEETGINYSTLRNRINRNKMTVEEAFGRG